MRWSSWLASFDLLARSCDNLQDRHVEESAQAASTDDCAIFEEAVRDEGDLGQVLLPETKQGKADDANDNHGDNVITGPTLGSTSSDVERDQD